MSLNILCISFLNYIDLYLIVSVLNPHLATWQSPFHKFGACESVVRHSKLNKNRQSLSRPNQKSIRIKFRSSYRSEKFNGFLGYVNLWNVWSGSSKSRSREQTQATPTSSFPLSEPLNLWIGKFYLVQGRRATDILKLKNCERARQACTLFPRTLPPWNKKQSFPRGRNIGCFTSLRCCSTCMVQNQKQKQEELKTHNTRNTAREEIDFVYNKTEGRGRRRKSRKQTHADCHYCLPCCSIALEDEGS